MARLKRLLFRRERRYLDPELGRRKYGIAASCFVGLAALLVSQSASTQSASESTTQLSAPVAANLNITPKRLTLDRGQRSATVYVFNQGRAPATFDISMVDRVMLPDGEIVPVTDVSKNPALQPVVGKLNSARDIVVAAPRRAVLAPGKGQTIRIRVTAPTSGSATEYRTHLTVMTVPPKSLGLTAEEAAKAEQSNQVSFQIATVYGVSIPVIVRSQQPDVRGEISNVRLRNFSDGRGVILSMDLNRIGTNSLFGNIEVRTKGASSPVLVARGIGVYPEINKRTFEVSLPRRPTSGEQLEITYVDDDSRPGRVIARATIVAP